MSQELVNSVNKLTDETSALLQEYVKGNTVLQNSASEAASSAAAAKVSEGITIDKANVATQKAAEAKQFRDETAAVATGGTATLEPTPGKIPLANAEAKLHAGWLPVNVSALSEAIVEAIRDVNKEQYAASGFIHDGKHFNSGNLSSVNEGMTVDIGTPNVIYLGARDGVTGSGLGGTSATNYPVMNVAGFEVHLQGINASLTNLQANTIKLPEATNGTVIYDSSGSCRGTGKPTLDLSKEVDPKYGDVAGSVNEAVARAFEGAIKNGDFRNGTNSWTSGNGANLSVENQVLKVASTGTAFASANVTTFANAIPANASILVEFVVVGNEVPSETANIGVFNSGSAKIVSYSGSGGTGLTAGADVSSARFNVGSHRLVMSSAAPTTSANFRNQKAASDTYTKYSNVSIKPLTEEIVINRVDMAGLEFFKRKVGEFLYPYGSPQCGYSEVDGIPTTEDTSRPITYFAAYDGDTTSRGRGWRLSDLTFAQLAVIMSNPKHNAWYNEKGELLQFGPRQRTIAGAGNGDWKNVNPAGTNVAYIGFDNYNRVRVQGMLDSAAPYSNAAASSFNIGANIENHANPNTGMGLAGNKYPDFSVDGECYFYVLATVPRLNQGAYHPSLNPIGSSNFEGTDGNAKNWYHTLLPDISTIADCFTTVSVTVDGVSNSGFIGSTQGSGRPDGRFYDAIYASGQGGVIDWRLPARDMSGKEEAAKVFQKVVNGTYRGIETLGLTKVLHHSDGESPSVVGFTIAGEAGSVKIGSKVYVESADGLLQELTVKSVSANVVTTNGVFNRKANGLVIVIKETNISVSGNFSTLFVIGSPEKIMATPALADGWMGSWCDDLPGALLNNYAYFNRKGVSPTLWWTHTNNNGGTWANSTTTFDTVVNGFSSPTMNQADRVSICSYTAFAKQTKSSINKPVLNGSEGIGDVIATDTHSAERGCLFSESLMGKVCTASSISETYTHKLKGMRSLVPTTGAIATTGKLPTHDALALEPPTNNSPAVKALWHQASNNQQATLNFLWNELVWNLKTPIQLVSGTPVNLPAGAWYYLPTTLSNKLNAGRLVRTENARSITPQDSWWGTYEVFDPITGESYSVNNGNKIAGVRAITNPTQAAWGDDSTIRIVDGQGTYINLNGDTCLYGTDELAMPYGYTKKQAGAGKQVVGVDL
ncbi:TPA: hypothetical protein RQK90_000035 [Vibrio vulnificus]|nr:hypothetical protein [Vibrio vulnificus]